MPLRLAGKYWGLPPERRQLSQPPNRGVPPLTVAAAGEAAYGLGQAIGAPLAAAAVYAGCEVNDAVADAIHDIFTPTREAPAPADDRPRTTT